MTNIDQRSSRPNRQNDDLDLRIRVATAVDLPTIVALLADDPLGAGRECDSDPLPDSYSRAFEEIARAPNSELVVVEVFGAVIGTMQIFYLPCLLYQGSVRAQLEAVNISKLFRGRGVGKRLIEWGIDRARQRIPAEMQ